MDFALNVLAQHYPAIGWLALIVIIGRVGWRASKMFTKFEDALERTDRVEKVVNKLATNHLPHIEEAINLLKDGMLDELRGLRQDILLLLRDR